MINEIKFISKDEGITLNKLEVEELFKILRLSSLSLIFKSSWNKLNKTRILKILSIGCLRKLFGRDGITIELQQKMQPYLFNFLEKEIYLVEVILTNNKTLLFDTKDIGIISLLWNFYDILYTNQYCISEEKMKDNIIVDCGANKGVFSLAAVALGAKKVYCFEPVPSSSKNISRTIRLNGMEERIELIQKALGEGNYDSEISFSFTGDGAAHIGGKQLSDSDIIKERIEVVKLDDYKLENVSFIKMDTEGFEAKILRGAKETIRKYKPILSLSAYHKPEDKVELPKLIKTIRNDYNIKLNNFSEEVFYCY